MKNGVPISPIQQYLEELHTRFKGVNDGAVADYIPELSTADPDWFGIAVVTIDGHVYQVGDTHEQFTIQSISKALVYGLALEDNGVEKILNKVGVEPSGDAFNSISLDPDLGRPLNPMINAGAIATTGLVKGEDHEQRLQRILDAFSRYVGHPLTINEAVYHSESATGHRNRAIGYMLRNFNILEEDPTDTLELYFQQCSINVDCRDLAVAAATLANGGVNPITGVAALRNNCIDKVLSVMSTCGMYDYAGSWIYEVGMPAKSGVGGGIMAVLPGQLGIGVFSPLLDIKGNSVRGIEVCKQLSKDFKLHIFNPARIAQSVMRARYNGTGIRSKRLRDNAESGIIDELGNTIRVYELHGDLTFGTTEIVVSELMRDFEQTRYFILDLKRVFSIDEASGRLLAALVELVRSEDKKCFFTYTENKYSFVRHMGKLLGNETGAEVFAYCDNDLVIEWCENDLIAQHLPKRARGKDRAEVEADITAQQLLKDFTGEEMAYLENLLIPLEFAPQQRILATGDAGDTVYFIIRGEVIVTLPINTGKPSRLAILRPGMAFGELGLVEDGHRTADVHAMTDVKVLTLTKQSLYERNDLVARQIQYKLMNNVARFMARNLHKAYAEIRALS